LSHRACGYICMYINAVASSVMLQLYFCFVTLGPERGFATTLGRTPLDECSARRRDLYLATHNTHDIQNSMPPAGFGPTIPASKRPQTLTLDRAVWQQCIFSPLISTYMFYKLLLHKCFIIFIQHKYEHGFSTHIPSHSGSPRASLLLS
jgi:hypothetical protein